jgi:hypothetical protein
MCSAHASIACAYDEDCPTGDVCQDPVPRYSRQRGTVIDRRTCLQWELKTGVVGAAADLSDPHNVNNAYTWSTGTPWSFDGTAASDFLAKLNAPPGFAGFTDWRLPAAEWVAPAPSQGPGCSRLSYGRDCLKGTTKSQGDFNLSPRDELPALVGVSDIIGPTTPDCYFSSSTDPNNSEDVLVLSFSTGSNSVIAGSAPKTVECFVRAVRGGP